MSGDMDYCTLMQVNRCTKFEVFMVIKALSSHILRKLSLSLLMFYVTCNDLSVIYVTSQMCRRTEEVVPTIGLPTL